MSLFKKKQEIPAVIYSLENRLQEAKDKKEFYFYYPLWDYELDTVRGWAMRKHIMVEVDHKTDKNIFYKFWGYK